LPEPRKELNLLENTYLKDAGKGLLIKLLKKMIESLFLIKDRGTDEQI